MRASVGQKSTKAITDSSLKTYSDDYTLTQLHTIPATILEEIVNDAAAGFLYVAVAYWSPFAVGGVLFVPVLALLGRLRNDPVEFDVVSATASGND